jgi:hypothetical protein
MLISDYKKSGGGLNEMAIYSADLVWVINWSFVPDSEYPDLAVLGFYVYPRGETAAYVESVAMPSGTSGSTYSYAGPGDYYVKVISANIESWTIIITPPN